MLPVDFLAMPDAEHGRGPRGIIDLIDDAVVADPDSPGRMSVSLRQPAGRGFSRKPSIFAFTER